MAEWRYARMAHGVQSVMMAGAVLMPTWLAISWDSPNTVRYSVIPEQGTL